MKILSFINSLKSLKCKHCLHLSGPLPLKSCIKNKKETSKICTKFTPNPFLALRSNKDISKLLSVIDKDTDSLLSLSTFLLHSSNITNKKVFYKPLTKVFYHIKNKKFAKAIVLYEIEIQNEKYVYLFLPENNISILSPISSIMSIKKFKELKIVKKLEISIYE